jgi:hypothetical protein
MHNHRQLQQQQGHLINQSALNALFGAILPFQTVNEHINKSMLANGFSLPL